LWIALQSGNLESLLTKANELEKEYEWLHAAEYYKKASKLALKKKDLLKVAEIHEQIGFSYSNAAYQAKTNEKFKSILKLAIDAYEQTAYYFKKTKNDVKFAKIKNSKAIVVLLNSRIEVSTSKQKQLIEKWWNLATDAIKLFEKDCDNLSFGKTCNDLLHNASYNRIFWMDIEEKIHECTSLGERAIKALKKLKNNYELARAYTRTAFYYDLAVWFGFGGNRREEFTKKALDYSYKAVGLSKKIVDAHLIGTIYNVASRLAYTYEANPVLALELNEYGLNQSRITKDNKLIGDLKFWSSFITPSLAYREEDPDNQRLRLKNGLKWTKESIAHFKIIGFPLTIFPSYRLQVDSLTYLASIETNLSNKQTLLIKAVNVARDFLKHSSLHETVFYWLPRLSLIHALYQLAKIKTQISEKRKILEEALKQNQELIVVLRKIMPSFNIWNSRVQSFLALLQNELAKIEPDLQKKIGFLRQAVLAMEVGMKLIKKDPREHIGWKSGLYGQFYLWFGEILAQLFSLSKEKLVLNRAIEIYDGSTSIFNETGLSTRAAESYWQKAKLYDKMGEKIRAACNYESASKKYLEATEKLPQLKEFYGNLSSYMSAWNQIEKARYNHSIEEYDKAKEHYEKAAKLHESSEPWTYLAPNYFAWASVEEAESLSRKEKTQQAKEAFQKALEQFSRSEESIKQKIGEISSEDEKEMTLRLLKTSYIRRKFCQARIRLEEAKLLDRKGEYLQSSKSYGEAAKEFETIIKKVETEAESKELKLITVLCRAWQKMAIAEETTSSEAYLEAAQLFDQAKKLSITKKTSLWALGNSSFCKGLAAQNKFQNTLDKSFNSKANKHVKNASSYYKEAGFNNAYEYAKATQRLFDAYLYMNSAEDEVDPEKKTKYYKIAEQLLQIAAGSFMKAKQPEKTSEVQRILATVKEEKALAASLTQVMQAPSIASSTLSFATPTPSSEVSAGLDSFEHANVQANLVTHVKEVKVGESFCLSIEFVNAGKEPALLTRVEDFVPVGFVVVKKPELYRLEDTALNMKGKQIAPLKLVEAKVVLQPLKKGVFQIKPKVCYLDELSQNKSLTIKAIEIKVEEVIFEDRVSTGTKELDSLLLGGIPKEYAVVLTGPPSDEREHVINNFLEAGTKQEQTTFYVTTEPNGIENLLEKPNFYLFLCNPKPKTKVPDLPNVTKLRSKTDINNLNMALSRASRNIEQKQPTTKRVCIEIVSDVLLRQGPEVTRRWLSELITDLTSKGFIMLAVMDPEMHPSDQSKAVLNLFDGEINLDQTQEQMECKKHIQIKKLRNQEYIKNPICLAK
jgi:KaiC/GvpD/RAD55 family RecA-like ATPase